VVHEDQGLANFDVEAEERYLCSVSISEEAMAKFTSTQATELEEEVLEQDDDFFFDEEEDDFLERSQRKLLKEKRERIPRSRDY
jgi:hypothetical protein